VKYSYLKYGITIIFGHMPTNDFTCIKLSSILKVLTLLKNLNIVKNLHGNTDNVLRYPPSSLVIGHSIIKGT